MTAQTDAFPGYTIAAIVPAYNEEVTIAQVVTDLREAVPGMRVYVFDNASSDETSARAAQAGAIVRHVKRPGKGNVVREAFADIDADIYLMIDGDDTYDASCARGMIARLIDHRLDHVLGCRVDNPDASAYRPGHAQGNRAFNALVSRLFGDSVTDMLSGYRVFSRRFVKSFPALSRAFEIETELTVHSMGLRVRQEEYPVGFKDRPAGSESKLNTYRDGFAILSLISRLFILERPALFYGVLGGFLGVLGLLLGIPVVVEYAYTGLVPRFPTAILAASLVTLAVIVGTLGTIMAGQLRARREATRIAYLAQPSLPEMLGV